MAIENCPRCLAREGIAVQLSFKAFQLGEDRIPIAKANTEEDRQPSGAGLS
jgi:hypothetical protein